MQHIFIRIRNSEEEKESNQPSTIKLQFDDAQLEQVNNTRRRHTNPTILPKIISELEQKLIRSLIFSVTVLVVYLLILITLHLMTGKRI